MAAQREWYTTDYYKILGVTDKATDKELHARLSQARKAVPPRHEPRLRGPLQGDLRRLRRPRRPRETQGVRRSPPSRSSQQPRRLRRVRRRRQRHLQLPRRRHLRHLRRLVRPRRSRLRPRHARKRSPSWPRSRGGASPVFPGGRRRCCHDGQRLERHALLDLRRLGLPARARCRWCARAATGSASSTTTRACSLCRRRARSARAGAPTSSIPARPATARDSSSANDR